MLRKISVRNIALIRHLELDFTKGLTVLTGETGAGKSLIVDALNFILGAKADKTLVSYGSEKASVEALFDINKELQCAFEQGGYDCEDGEVLLSRIVSSEGKSEIRINGKITTLSVLKNFTSSMADIHGQHEHQSLLNTATHRQLLDNFGGENIKNSLRPLDAICAEHRAILKELKSIGGSDAERLRAADLLQYQINEIENARLSNEEEIELNQKHFLAINAEKLSEGLSQALKLLNGNGSKLGELGRVGGALADLTRFDDRFSNLSARANSAYLELEDIFQDLDSYLGEHYINPKEVDVIADRLEEYKKLKRKYGSTVNEIKDYLSKAKAQNDNLINSTALMSALTTKLEKVNSTYSIYASELSLTRKEFAKKLETSVLRELEDLGMGSSKFEVRFESKDGEPSPHGFDLVEFYLSTNKGEPAKPLSKVISGGEMSRFMLALKVIAANADGVETVVFDEIDAGISGKVGEALACKLAKLSRLHQVLCISHLPYIAAMSDCHFYIHKEELNGRTETQVDSLDENGMINEISRLVGGSDISSHSLSHSAELKEWCDRFKLSLN